MSRKKWNVLVTEICLDEPEKNESLKGAIALLVHQEPIVPIGLPDADKLESATRPSPCRMGLAHVLSATTSTVRTLSGSQ